MRVEGQDFVPDLFPYHVCGTGGFSVGEALVKPSLIPLIGQWKEKMDVDHRQGKSKINPEIN